MFDVRVTWGMNFGNLVAEKLDGMVEVMSSVRDLLKGLSGFGAISQSDAPGMMECWLGLNCEGVCRCREQVAGQVIRD